MLGIASVTFEQLSSQASPNHSIISTENIPIAVTKVREPTARHGTDLGNRFRHRLTRLSRRQLADSIDHLPVALRAWEASLPAERITQKIETRLTTINHSRLLGMERQVGRCDKTLHFLKCRLGFVLTTTQDHESSSPGESHPRALPEPDVNLSAHPAPIVQSQVEFQFATSPADWVRGGPRDPANEPPAVAVDESV